MNQSTSNMHCEEYDNSFKTIYTTVDPAELERKKKPGRRTVKKSKSVDFTDIDGVSTKKKATTPTRRRGLKKAVSSDGLMPYLGGSPKKCRQARRSIKVMASDELLPDESLDVVPWHDVVDADELERTRTRALRRNNSVDHIVLQENGGEIKKSPVKKKKKDPNREKKIEFYRMLNFRDIEDGVSGFNATKVSKMMDELPRVAKDKYLFTEFSEPISALHMLCALDAPLPCIKKCYKLNPNALKDASSTIGSPLHYACWFNTCGKTLRYLVSQDVDALLLRNRAKRTALHLACLRRANADLVVMLTEACPDAAKLADHEGKTPLHLALQVEKPMLAVVEDLTEVCPEAIAMPATKTESTPLHVAATNKVGVDILKDLILSNPKALKVQDAEGRAPLHLAVLHKCTYKEIKVLVKKYPKATLLENQIGETPLQIAKFLRLDEEIIELLSPYKLKE